VSDVDNLTDDPRIASDLEWLFANDTFFKSHFPADYAIQRARGHANMAGLIRIVIGQQVSTKAADSLWLKFTTQFNPADPEPIMNVDDDVLRACGLSRQKVGYVKGLAAAIHDKKLQPETWNNKSSVDVTTDITALKGFGLWSAQMFLMFNLARPDIWPAGDLGIQIGTGLYFNLSERPTEKQTLEYGHHFAGRETAAALLIWSIKDGGI
jgi:DNA-3-methyladenine glycosylase II